MSSQVFRISSESISEANARALADVEREYAALSESLERRGTLRSIGHDIDSLTDAAMQFTVAVPSWGVGTGGTRFGRFPGPGEPTNVFEKLADVATIHQLSGGAPDVSLHIPWDQTDDPNELKQFANNLGLGFDAMNSNTFQDQPGQALSYKYGSLCHTDAAVRSQAIDHNLEVIDYGKRIGSDALTIWIGDGGNFPGQIHLRRAYDHVFDSLSTIYKGLPASWRLFTEHKPYEPAFYSTVVQDWGTSLLLCQTLGPQAFPLVDLGHHLPNTNVELIVARLITAGRLGGFHLNDSKYGDDDLTAGSIHPYQLFLIFNELVDAQLDESVDKGTHKPAYMIDQSHNIKDPIEALIATVDETRKAYIQALIVDRGALHKAQECNDALAAELILKDAYDTDVRPILRMARHRQGAAIEPIAIYRGSGYRQAKAKERRADVNFGGGIV